MLQYPDGNTIIKELIQNADDAKATEVKIIYDKRTFKGSNLLSEKISNFMGPSLLCYNNSIFEKEDFESMKSLANSAKQANLTKTGKFGIGFQSVYHLTDLPSFVTGESLVMLDPHSIYLDQKNAETGKIWNFRNDLKDYDDQILPYKIPFLGCNMNDYFKGTLFRFPLRNEQCAKVSQISKKPYTNDNVEKLVKSFQQEGSEILLFLKNIQSVEILEIESENSPKVLYSININNINQEIINKRKELVTKYVSQGPGYLRKIISQEPPIIFEPTLQLSSPNEKSLHKWLVCGSIGMNSRDFSLQYQTESNKLIPWTQIAIKIPFDFKQKQVFNGKMFCFLPLPTNIGLKFHINGFFELSMNRIDLWIGDNFEGEGRIKSDWNKSLQKDLVFTVCLALEHLKELISPKDIDQLCFYYDVFPNLSKVHTHWNVFENFLPIVESNNFKLFF